MNKMRIINLLYLILLSGCATSIPLDGTYSSDSKTILFSHDDYGNDFIKVDNTKIGYYVFNGYDGQFLYLADRSGKYKFTIEKDALVICPPPFNANDDFKLAGKYILISKDGTNLPDKCIQKIIKDAE